jgi:hypothetical protein
LKPTSIDGAAEPTAEAIRLCRNFAMQKLGEAQENAIFDVDDTIKVRVPPTHGVCLLQNRSGGVTVQS